MGIFGKLFGALKKTKDNFSGKLRTLFSKNKLGDEFYEELEEIYNKYMIPIGNGLCTPNEDYNWEKDYPGLNERICVEDFLNMLENGPQFDFYNDNNCYGYHQYYINIDDNTFTYVSDEEITVNINDIMKNDFDINIFI